MATQWEPQGNSPRTLRALYHWVWNNLKGAWNAVLLHEANPDAHHKRVEWLKPYSPGDPAIIGDMVLDDGWLMIANKDTVDPASPQPVGQPFYYYEGAMGEDSALASQIIFGNRYTTTADGYLSGYRVYVVTGNVYRVASITDPLGAAIYNELALFTAQITGWQTFTINPVFVTPGAVFDLVAGVQEPDPTPVVLTANYNYQTPQNVSVPASGQISHARGQPDVMNVHYIDDDGFDRTAGLQALDIGDVIDGANTRWVIQAGADQGTYIQFAVAPALVGTPTGSQAFDFETVEPTPITYGVDPNWWGNQGITNAQGLLGIDIPTEDIVPNDTAYGTDLLVQYATVSDDWDAMAYTENLGAPANPVIRTETALRTSSFIDQDPTGLGVAMQVTFGPITDSTEAWDVAADGTMTCLISDEYHSSARLVIGRSGGGGEAQIYMRALINDVPFVDSSHVIVDNARLEMPLHFEGTIAFSAGDTFKVEIIRDTDANDSGGLRAGIPDIAWNPSPSARLIMTRTYLV